MHFPAVREANSQCCRPRIENQFFRDRVVHHADFKGLFSSNNRTVRRMYSDQYADNVPIMQIGGFPHSHIDISCNANKHLSTKKKRDRTSNIPFRSSRSEPDFYNFVLCEEFLSFFDNFSDKNVRNRLIIFLHKYNIFILYIFASFYYIFLMEIIFIKKTGYARKKSHIRRYVT